MAIDSCVFEEFSAGLPPPSQGVTTEQFLAYCKEHGLVLCTVDMLESVAVALDCDVSRRVQGGDVTIRFEKRNPFLPAGSA